MVRFLMEDGSWVQYRYSASLKTVLCALVEQRPLILPLVSSAGVTWLVSHGEQCEDTWVLTRHRNGAMPSLSIVSLL